MINLPVYDVRYQGKASFFGEIGGYPGVESSMLWLCLHPHALGEGIYAPIVSSTISCL